MTLNELSKNSSEKLHNIENGTTDARIIIKKVMSVTDTDFFIFGNCVVDDKHIKTVESMVQERLSGIPVQYIIGEWDFYGNTFTVNENVLVPRPETEILCEYVIGYLKNKKNPVVADLCAGSGCIGITVKNEISSADVTMVEKSPEAASVNRSLGRMRLHTVLQQMQIFVRNLRIFWIW